jgi:hypothetical protein
MSDAALWENTTDKHQSVTPGDILVWCVFFKPCTKLKRHCNPISGHCITENTESLLLLRRHLKNWPRGPAVSMRRELFVAHERLGQFPLLTVYVVPVWGEK